MHGKVNRSAGLAPFTTRERARWPKALRSIRPTSRVAFDSVQYADVSDEIPRPDSGSRAADGPLRPPIGGEWVAQISCA